MLGLSQIRRHARNPGSICNAIYKGDAEKSSSVIVKKGAKGVRSAKQLSKMRVVVVEFRSLGRR